MQIFGKIRFKIPLRAKQDEFLDPLHELFTTEVQFFQLSGKIIIGGDTAKLLLL